VAPTGLIAHGRGEAFDYLLGKRTTRERAKGGDDRRGRHPRRQSAGDFGQWQARGPLRQAEVVALAQATRSRIEVNLIADRTRSAWRRLLLHGEGRCRGGTGQEGRFAPPWHLLGPREVHKEGIYSADVVLVPLEDGDRPRPS